MISTICIVSLFLSAVSALPNGAPVCIIGTPNVNNAHLFSTRDQQTGNLENGGWVVSLNGVAIKNTAAGRNVFFIETGKNTTVSVKSATGELFKGALVLLSNNRTPTENTKAKLSPTGTGWEEAIGCSKLPHAGFSHNNNNTKSEFTGTIFYDKTGQTLNLDVNIVEVNNAVQGSTYYYSQYKLKVVTFVTAKPCTLLRLLTGRC